MVIQTSTVTTARVTVVCFDKSNYIINKIKSLFIAGDYEIVHNQGGNVNPGQIYTKNNFNMNRDDGMFD